MVSMTDSHNNSSAENRSNAGRLVPAAASLQLPRAPYGQLGAYAGGGHAPQAEVALDLLEYWRIFNKRKWVIASVLVAFVALGTLRTLMMTPLYTATVRLQIDRHVAKVVEGGNITPVEGSDLEFLRTQYELLQSRTMAERVAAMLKLGDDASLFRPTQFSFIEAVMALLRPAADPLETSKAARERAAAGIVAGNRTVRPVAGSRLVDVSYTDPAPLRALRIVTAYADAFVAANLDKRFQANAYAKTFLEDQIKQLKIRLEDSERVLLDFAQKEQIVAATERSSIAESNLASANAALANLISERIKNEQLWRQVESTSTINLSQLLSNGVIDGLRLKRNSLVTEYQEKLETFKPSYPTMIQIDNKIKEIDRQLAVEVRTIRQSLKAAYQSSLSQEKEMRGQIEVLRAEVLDLQRRSIEYNILKREVDTSRSLYEGLLQRFKEVDVAGGVGANNVFVIDKAELPAAPSSPSMLRALMLSLALGLGAGLAAAFALERLDDTVRLPDEIERTLGLATLGVIPRVGGATTIEGELGDPRSSIAEAYRSMCTALQFAAEGGLPRSLLVTSAGPAEGKSITSVAVARHFAMMGQKVLLIDADLRNHSLHVRLGRDAAMGLSNYLAGHCSPPEAFQATDIANLAFLASGPLPPNAADLLAGSRLHSLLTVGMEVFDLIVIDGPPVMGLADAPLLSSAAAATVLIVAAGQVRKGLLHDALRRIRLTRGPIIGGVLTKFDVKRAGYGFGYGYGYGYGHAGQAYGLSRNMADVRQSQLTRADEAG